LRIWQINFSSRSLLYFLGVLGLGSLVGAYFMADVLIRYEKYWLDVKMAGSRPDVAQLFFNTGKGYNERESNAIALHASDQPTTYRFGLPAQQILSLRFDVLSHEGRTTIVSAGIVDNRGKVLRTFDAADFVPQACIRIASSRQSGLVFETVPISAKPLDPILLIRNSSFIPANVSAKYSLWFLLSALSLFVGGLGSAVFGIWAARRIRKNHKYRDPEFHYRVAIMTVVSLTFIYALCLPLIVSPDGMEYARLAYVLFSPDFVSEWNFYRTPLFPLSLRVSFFLGGEQPESALLLTTLF